MAYKITDECLACGACIDECPNEAISEGDDIYVIDAEKCDDCATCVEVLPERGDRPRVILLGGVEVDGAGSSGSRPRSRLRGRERRAGRGASAAVRHRPDRPARPTRGARA